MFALLGYEMSAGEEVAKVSPTQSRCQPGRGGKVAERRDVQRRSIGWQQCTHWNEPPLSLRLVLVWVAMSVISRASPTRCGRSGLRLGVGRSLIAERGWVVEFQAGRRPVRDLKVPSLQLWDGCDERGRTDQGCYLVSVWGACACPSRRSSSEAKEPSAETSASRPQASNCDGLPQSCAGQSSWLG